MPPAELTASVLYAGIAMTRRMVDSGDGADDALRYLRQGNAFLMSLDFDLAFLRAREWGWDLFDGQESDAAAFRQTIENLILRAAPIWAVMLPRGRNKVREVLTDDARHCFTIAQLWGNEGDTVAWWDRVSGEVRYNVDLRRLQAGRRAEVKTLERERQLLTGTGYQPVWTAIEDNTAGYDIRSWRETGNDTGHSDRRWRPQYIEVKSSSHGEAIYLTRNEWELAAERHRHWEMDVWIGNSGSPLVLGFDEIRPHVPCDQGQGEWQDAKISVHLLSTED